MNNLSSLPTGRPLRQAIFLAALFFPCGTALGQDSPDPRLPEAARLALRARAGDAVKTEGDRKVTTHVHLEALAFELTSETNVKDQGSYQFKGRGPNGTLLFDTREISQANATNNMGQSVKQRLNRALACTVKPNMEVVKASVISSSGSAKKTGAQSTQLMADVAAQTFGAIRFPDRVLKSGDSWSGTLTLKDQTELKGVTLKYDATIVAFEMYQSFPAAHVEIHYAYKGPLPSLDAQVKKGLPKGSTLKGDAELSGTETTYYSLDRGWPLNDQLKMNVVLNYSMSINGRQLDFGGTIDADDHSAVTACPPFAPALVPAVGGSSSN